MFLCSSDISPVSVIAVILLWHREDELPVAESSLVLLTILRRGFGAFKVRDAPKVLPKHKSILISELRVFML